MKKIVFMIAVLCFCFNGFAQFSKRNKATTFGLIADGNFSTLYYHGVSPSFTIGNDCNSIQIGPRIPYQYFVAKDNDRFNFVGDLEYRITYFNKWRFVDLFAFFRSEYGLKKSAGSYVYNADFPDPAHANLGESDLLTEFNTHKHHVNFYIGQGMLVNFDDNFYLKLNGGLGISVIVSKTHYYDVEDDHQVGEQLKINGQDQMQFMLSAGIGWRL